MKLINYFKEVFFSSLPLLVTIIVVVSIFPVSGNQLIQLGVGYVSVVVGQTIFLTGLDQSILPIGKLVGGSVTKLKKLAFVLLFGFLFGLLATAAEPAISVLAEQIAQINPDINRILFVWVVSFGTGISVGFAIYRLIKNIDIRKTFFVLYILIFAVVFFVPNQYVALAFDASGATTGDISVPFILALGLGISHTISKRNKGTSAHDDSFGMVGLASVGPILMVFIYGLITGNNPNPNAYLPGENVNLGEAYLANIGNVILAIVPIIAVFLIFQFILIKLPRKELGRIFLGSFVVFIGLLIFLSGIDFGFAFAGKYIGEQFMDPNREWLQWLLIPVAFILGFAITISEPAVVVLGDEVEDLTNGHIGKLTIKMSLGLSIGIASILSILTILLEIPILYFLAPLYAIALILLWFTPKLFVGLAFDSGGVTGGAITSAFLTPLTLGASQALGQDILINGLGIIAFISVTPLIIIQLLGIMYERKVKRSAALVSEATNQESSDIDTLIETESMEAENE